MAERQETSVMASIQDILRDAQLREEQEKVAAQRAAEAAEQARLDAIRRQQEDEERRIREEEEERQRRAFEEQRKAAELQALHEATVQKARMEAEAQARLAEMNARQEHERQLNALRHDKSKKRLVWGAVVLGLLLVGGGTTAAVMIVGKAQENEALQASIRKANDEKRKLEDEQATLATELKNTKDPEKIAQLEAQLKEKQANIEGLNRDLASKGASTAGAAPPVVHRGGPAGPAAPAQQPAVPARTCRPGDPLCAGM